MPLSEAELFALMRPAKVCVCRSVTENSILEELRSGQARTFVEVQNRTGCSTGCGTCEMRVRRIISDYFEKNKYHN